MQLEKGSPIMAKDCHGRTIAGEVVNFLENTVIVERAGQNFIITKKELKKQGYTFPPYKKIKYFQTQSEKDET